MHMWMDGWDWLWMTLMIGFWLVVVGAVVFVAVRMSQTGSRTSAASAFNRRSSSQRTRSATSRSRSS